MDQDFNGIRFMGNNVQYYRISHIFVNDKINVLNVFYICKFVWHIKKENIIFYSNLKYLVYYQKVDKKSTKLIN